MTKNDQTVDRQSENLAKPVIAEAVAKGSLRSGIVPILSGVRLAPARAEWSAWFVHGLTPQSPAKLAVDESGEKIV